MGSGTFTTQSFHDYAASRGRKVDTKTDTIVGNYNYQEFYKANNLNKNLNPHGVTRECCDSDEHPNVIPVILALDVTGSMGDTATQVAVKLGKIMRDLYTQLTDVEFMVMGIGDLATDAVPLQVGQFESDIRIADQLEQIYFEGCGGGNGFESYSLAWYFALNHTKIDAINNRNKKGIIITIGDEHINPYLPVRGKQASFKSVLDDDIKTDINTKDLYAQVKSKFECFHIHVDHSHGNWSDDDDYNFNRIKPEFEAIIGKDRCIKATLDTIDKTITTIIVNNANKDVDK